MHLLNKVFITLLISMPTFVFAHVGHDHSHGFWSGFLHPFTGLDHLMMATAFGVLMWTATQCWKFIGLIYLASAMVLGFVVGSQDIVPSFIAEYGIIASLFLMAIALWTKVNPVLPITAILLASFHGVAHGSELGQSGHASLLILGMVVAMALIYIFGVSLGFLVQKYVPYGKKIVGTLVAIVAVIGLA